MELHERKRSFNINSLSIEDAEALSVQIGQRVTEICDKACEEANRLLNIYGMEAKMQFQVGKIGELTKEPIKKQHVSRKKAATKKKSKG